MKREYRDVGIKFWMKDAADNNPTVRMSSRISRELWERSKSVIDAFFEENSYTEDAIMLYMFPAETNAIQATHYLAVGQCYSKVVSNGIKDITSKLTGGINGKS